jgi:hypothetical protein
MVWTETLGTRSKARGEMKKRELPLLPLPLLTAWRFSWTGAGHALPCVHQCMHERKVDIIQEREREKRKNGQSRTHSQSHGHTTPRQSVRKTLVARFPPHYTR